MITVVDDDCGQCHVFSVLKSNPYSGACRGFHRTPTLSLRLIDLVRMWFTRTCSSASSNKACGIDHRVRGQSILPQYPACESLALSAIHPITIRSLLSGLAFFRRSSTIEHAFQTRGAPLKTAVCLILPCSPQIPWLAIDKTLSTVKPDPSIGKNLSCKQHVVVSRRFTRIFSGVNFPIRADSRAFEAFALRCIPPKNRHPQPIAPA